jgi:tetratricopeptide (TPR) repeat protein
LPRSIFPLELVHLLSESLAIAREINDTKWVAGVLQPLGMACLGVGDMVAARRYLQEAVALARELGNERELTAALNALAMLHRLEGRLDEAAPICEQVLALTRELGDQEYIAIALLNLAMVWIGINADERARLMLLEVMKISEEIGSKPVRHSALEVCAGLAAARNHWRQAAQLFGVAEAQRELTKLRRDPADQAFLDPLIARARQALGHHTFASAEEQGRTLPIDAAFAQAHEELNESA